MATVTEESVRAAQKRPDRRMLTATPPAPMDLRVPAQVRKDLRDERRARRRGPMPPGNPYPSWTTTLTTFTDPLKMLLENRRRYGPVFTLRHGHELIVWAISPTANHEVLVSKADAFGWREGRFRDLWPLMGDGFFAIDGDYHRQMRRMLLPGFHADAVHGVAGDTVAEVVAAVEQLPAKGIVDINHWVRDTAMRVALRVLLGIDREDDEIHRIANAFERALAFHGYSIPTQMLRGPRTPYARTQQARAELDGHVYEEIRRRRAAGDPGRGVLGLLLQCTDGDGNPLPEHTIRDLAITVMFAGHDTTTATFTFLTYELGRHPHAREALLDELDTVLGENDPTPDQLDGRALPVLERTLDETLRRYPIAWIGPRRVLEDVELDGVMVPKGVGMFYSSWATHHLEELYPSPMAFDPDRFLPGGQVEQLPKGSYIPFGGGSRMCLGKRFAQYELRALTAVALRRFTIDPDPADPLKMSFTPTLGPKNGLRYFVTRRD